MAKKITDEMFKQRIKKMYGTEYTALTPYTRSTEDVVVRHNKCGNTFNRSPNHLLKDKRGCPYCALGNKKDPKRFAKEFKKVAKGKYKLLDSYVASYVKIKVEHLTCGNVYEVNPSCFLGGTQCPKCYGKFKKTTNEFKQEVSEITNSEYACISEYNGNKRDVLMKHKKCGYVYKVHPHDFLRGTRCPYCNQTMNEKFISHIIEEQKIDFEIQKRFPDCGDIKHRLYFDFYIPSLKLLVEYDGIQHFKPVKHFGGEQGFIEQVQRDHIKNEYALNHGISVLRLPYTFSKEHLKSYLVKFLNDCKARSREPKLTTMI